MAFVSIKLSLPFDLNSSCFFVIASSLEYKSANLSMSSHFIIPALNTPVSKDLRKAFPASSKFNPLDFAKSLTITSNSLCTSAAASSRALNGRVDTFVVIAFCKSSCIPRTLSLVRSICLSRRSRACIRVFLLRDL